MDIILLLEQKNCHIKPSDWLVANSATRADIMQVNPLVKALENIWLKHKKFLVPSNSLLQKCTWHLSFRQLDFSNWKKTDFERFNDSLVKGHLPESLYFQARVNKYNPFQYLQLKSN